MIDIILSLPGQIKHSLAAFPREINRKMKIKNIFIAGMGGSGISGDLLRAFYPDLPVFSCKDYTVPGFVNKQTLAILISYSGNTEETLSVYRQAKKQQARVIILTSNGKLAGGNAILKIGIPKGLPPRGAIGYLYTPLPMILYHCGMIKKNPANELKDLADFLERFTAEITRNSKRISHRIYKKLTIIYANSALFYVVAERWRCQLNENAKVLAHVNVIPEMNHNEIVGFGRPAVLNRHSSVIFLNDPLAHRRNITRVKIVKKIVKPLTSEIIDILPPGRNRLQQAFAAIMLGDMVSYYCAVLNRIDPLPVTRIDYLKQELQQL